MPDTNNLTFTYDANGSVTKSGEREISWTAFDKPERMLNRTATTGAATGSIYEYGPNQQRIYKKEAKFSALNQVIEHGEETIYLDNYERITDDTGGITHRYTIETGGHSIQIERADNSNVDQPKYLLADNLGSTNVILDGLGQIEQRLAFDPWGLRMNAGDNSQVNSVTNRGYTGHEMDDETGLINMNARVYDPYLGRFLSADPVLPDAGDMQQFNRYAYVTNNPLKYVDPTGNSGEACFSGNVAACAADIIVTSFLDFLVSVWGSGGCEVECKPVVGAGRVMGEDGTVSLPGFCIENPDACVILLGDNGNINPEFHEEVRGRNREGDGESGDSESGNSESGGGSSPPGGSNFTGPGNLEDLLNKYDNEILFGEDLLTRLLREVTDPISALLEGRVLEGACGIVKLCRGLGKVGGFGQTIINKAIKRFRNSRRKIDCIKCFVAGTLVLTSGGLQAIETLEVGDMVAAKGENDADGELEWKPITETFIVPGRPIVELIISDNATRQISIETTPDHPFWVVNKGWTDVEKLLLGDKVVDHEGEEFSVTNINHTGVLDTTYNFTVQDFHTYFVGSEGIWVHNCPKKQNDRSRRGGNRRDGKEITDAAKRIGVDREELSKLVHEVKRFESRPGDGNLEFDDLLKLAESLKGGG